MLISPILSTQPWSSSGRIFLPVWCPSKCYTFLTLQLRTAGHNVSTTFGSIIALVMVYGWRGQGDVLVKGWKLKEHYIRKYYSPCDGVWVKRAGSSCPGRGMDAKGACIAISYFSQLCQTPLFCSVPMAGHTTQILRGTHFKATAEGT